MAFQSGGSRHSKCKQFLTPLAYASTLTRCDCNTREREKWVVSTQNLSSCSFQLSLFSHSQQQPKHMCSHHKRKIRYWSRFNILSKSPEFLIPHHSLPSRCYSGFHKIKSYKNAFVPMKQEFNIILFRQCNSSTDYYTPCCMGNHFKKKLSCSLREGKNPHSSRFTFAVDLHLLVAM